MAATGRAIPVRRKALLIGINYSNTAHELKGCINDVRNVAAWLVSRGYSGSPRDMVFLTDERAGPYAPTAHNMLAAMDWLVGDPGCALFLHFSGHGGQVARAHDGGGGGEEDGRRRRLLRDTIVPLDFATHGMIDSATLHRHLVRALPRDSTLFVLFDCCHSGSAIELPWVYRPDAVGTVTLMDNIHAGKGLVADASHLIRGGLRFDHDEAADLVSGTRDFFRGLKRQFGDEGGDTKNGLARVGDFEGAGPGQEEEEGRRVFMFSACKDSQKSADSKMFRGKPVGAMR